MTSFFRFIVLFISVSFFAISSFAQSSLENTTRQMGKLTGTIVDSKTGEAVEYANVVLFSSKDSSLVGGTITNPDGSFVIEKVRPGNFYLKISFIGYLDYIHKGVKVSPNNPVIDLGAIKLSSNVKLLKEFEVSEERSVMEYKLDKRVINVDKNIVTSGGTATDVLDNVPSVAVDNDGNITLRGSTNVKILVDGKPSELLGGDIQQILEQIPATTIETVEVITNPSAKYNPEGMSGIINIKLKEKRVRGLNGMVSLNAGSALPQFLPTTSGSLNLSYNTGKFNFFTAIDGNLRNGMSDGNSTTKKFKNDSLFSDIYQTTKNKRNNNSGSFKFGTDYQINSKNNITVAYLYRKSKRTNTSDIATTDYINSLNGYTQESSSNRNEDNHNVSLSYNKRFSQKDRELSVDASWGLSNNDGNSDIEQVFNNSLKPSFKQWSNSTGDNNNVYFQLNYIHPFSDKMKLETGYNGTYNTIDNNNLYYLADISENKYLDSLNSNSFTYNENINALYATFGYLFNPKLSAQAGLRFEYVNTLEKQPAIPQGNFEKNYSQFYPTVHLSYSISQFQSAQLSYSRRVRRPNIWQLNPFRNYSNQEYIDFGNPQLNPEYTNSIELSYNRAFPTTNVFISTYFRQTSDIINRFQFLWTEENAENYGFYWDNDTSKRTARTFMNIDKGINYGFEAVVDQKITKWWKVNLSINLYNSSVNGASMGFNKTRSGILANYKLNSYTTLPWNIILQFSGQYRSGWITVQGKIDPSYFFDVALKKDIMKRNGTINIRISDIFATRKFGGTVDTPELQNYFTNKRISPVLSVGFSYKINQGLKKAKDKSPSQMQEDDSMEM